MNSTGIFNTGDPNKMVNIDGHLVERDALAIVERIKEIDPNLEVLCIDPESAIGVSAAPFIIVELCPDGQYRRIFECWSLDGTVIERVQAARLDGKDLLAEIDKINAIAGKEIERKKAEEAGKRQDLVKHVVANTKSQYSFKDESTGEKVTIYEDRPSERK